MGSCCSAIICPGCHGDMDKSAVAKVFMVFIYTFLMAGYFFSFGMGCEKMSTDGLLMKNARYDFWRRTEARQELIVCFDKSSVNVMAYFAVYVVLCCISVVGATCMFLTIKGYNKLYAICLFGAWVWLSIMDFWTLGSMLNYFESVMGKPDFDVNAIQSYTESYTGNLRSEYGFRIMGIWFAETYIFLTTAWDAFDRSDERPKQYAAY